MKIKFLGTSAGWPLPRLGCKDKICSSIDPKDKRTRSQALVNDRLLLDIGPDTYLHLSQPDVNPTLIEYAAITHEHSDHTFGLWDLGHIYNAQPIKVIIDPSTFRKIRKLFFYKEYKVLKIASGSSVRDLDLEISLLRLNHTNSSFGILIQGEGKKFFWAPDFKTFPAETINILKKIDLVAMDGSELKIPTANHQTIEEGILLGKRLGAEKNYFIHLGHRTLPHKELENFIKKKGGFRFEVAYDGLEIKV